MNGKPGALNIRVICITIFMIAFTVFARAVETHDTDTSHQPGNKKFNAGRLMIDHIVDAYEWHILDIGKTHVSVPLPVILIYEGKFHVFMSSKFHHGHDSYAGFKIEDAGSRKGKIVRVKEGTMETDVQAGMILDFSITKNVFGIFVSAILLILIFTSVAKAYTRRQGQAPKGLQSFLEPVILFIRDDVARAAIGKKADKFMPYLMTLFFFIFLNNLLGLIPIFPFGANVTGNLAVTGGLALMTFLVTNFSGNKNYWAHIFNTPGVPWWLKFPLPLMPIVEILGMFTKPFVLMVRLFANITAGHLVILGFMSLIFVFSNMQAYLGLAMAPVSVAFGIFMSFLELLVAFIQAYVFTLLSALYFGMAVEEHH
ncbi:MAG: F0F1 ATP synthase subunit A [Bacteroidales bacterium]|nr:F0F1 ATP synthase subunit A [Bacteroidales bacterium]